MERTPRRGWFRMPDQPVIARAGAATGSARHAPAAARSRSQRRLAAVGKAILFCAALAGCQPDHAEDGGSNAMFGLFKGKGAGKLATTVAPELHATLKRETTLPRTPAPAADARCASMRVAGVPPQAKFVADDFDGDTRTGFRIASQAGVPALGIVNVGGQVRRPEFWELKSDADPGFVRKRAVQFDPQQDSWSSARVFQIACLPGRQLAVGLVHAESRPTQTLLSYDTAANTFRKVAEIVYDSSSGSPASLFDTLPAGPEATLLVYHTGEIRLKAEVYVREHDHVLVFSPKHPQGLEVLALGLDDGNVAKWALSGKTLWLESQDRRDTKQPRQFFWSLDLSAVL